MSNIQIFNNPEFGEIAPSTRTASRGSSSRMCVNLLVSRITDVFLPVWMKKRRVCRKLLPPAGCKT